MKKLGVLLVALLLIAGSGYAQERGGGDRPSKTARPGGPGGRGDRPQMTPEQMIQRQTQRLVEDLKLNKDQEAKVQAINKKYQANNPMDWSKMRDASDDERAKMREEMMKTQAEKNKEIKTILTAEQVKLYDEMLKKREEMRKNGQGRTGVPGGQGQ